jgi:acetate---CoA ligase (ADP-forming)
VDNAAINAILRPKNIAVIGASTVPGKIGYTVVKGLLEANYQGEIFPVNPQATELMGLKVYASILDIPGPVDAAVITVPAKFVPQVIDDCGKKGVLGLILITSGFSEVGNHELEEQIVRQANSYGSRILGPNIVGGFVQLRQIECIFRSISSLTRPGFPDHSIRGALDRIGRRHFHTPGRF